MFSSITRTVWVLSLVSLFTDMASEMLYPVMPLYLKQIGFTVVGIGILEGFAEAIAGLSKGYFGKWSDSKGKRLPFVQLGYSLSAISKPMMALFTAPWWIFTARSTDRIGKGIRTGARDALLSAEATPATKGAVFGFHRAMDTTGAMLGPALALLFLYFYPENYKLLFYVAFIPGLLAIAATFFVKEQPFKPKTNFLPASFFSFTGYVKTSSPEYRRLLIGLLAFALINSSDVFLLLKMKENGMTDVQLIGIYIFYNGIYALVAFPFGKLADKFGLKRMFLVGLILFSLVYFGMPLGNSPWIFIALFLLYGLYAAATEGIAKAWISNIVPKEETGTAIGTYTGFQSIASLFASSIAGFIWYSFGSIAVFLVSGVAALLVFGFIYFRVKAPVVEVEELKS